VAKGIARGTRTFTRFLQPTLDGATDCGLAALARLAARPLGPPRAGYIYVEIVSRD
jgi:hypothetical protein